MKACAVLTGDLVGSTRFAPEAIERAMAVLSSAAPEGHFTRYRGDGWQAVVAPPARALRAALGLIARLAAEDGLPATRIAIGLGPVESLGTADLSDARGAAFETSGRALDGIGRAARLAIDGTAITPLHRAIVALLDERSTRWTPEQARAIALALAPAEPTQAEIAATLGISAQAVNYRLAGAGWNALRQAVSAWEGNQ
jgi:hypothetical protein